MKVVIVGTLLLTVLTLIAIKYLHDRLQHRTAAMTDRYIDPLGCMSALMIGTIAVDMIVTDAQSTVCATA